MIAKKNPKADLEKKRFAFFQIGLIIAGSLCLAAFEYSTVTVEETYVMNDMAEGSILAPEPVPDYAEPKPQEQKKAIIQIIDEVKVVEKLIIESKAVVIEKGEEIIIDEGDTGDVEIGITWVEPKDPIVPVPDVEPEFPGGLKAMGEYINDHIDLPNYIADYDQGTVYVHFVVNKNGSIEQVEVTRGLSNELNKSAMDVVRKMPRWIPGEQAGKPVRVRFTLPIQIALH